MAKFEHILVDEEDGVATLTVDRPDKLNALNIDALTELGKAVESVPNSRALVVTGSGDSAFVAGADIEQMKDISVEEAYSYATLGHSVLNKLENFNAPVIAAINGYAFGGGCELALACDIRIASENAVIGQTEISLGIVPGWGGTQRLSRIVGDEKARRMVFLGERLNAEEAKKAGLVGEVVSQDELYNHVSSLTSEIIEKPVFALSAAKEALNLVHETGLSPGLAYEKRLWSELFGTNDQKEGMAAFLEKREPSFE